MNLYKKEIMKVFLKFVGRYCKEKPILIIKYDVEMVLHEKTEEEFIEWILKYSKENFSSEKHLELESKIKFIIGRNIKFEIPGTQQILDKIAIKKINVDLDVANERKILLKSLIFLALFLFFQKPLE